MSSIFRVKFWGRVGENVTQVGKLWVGKSVREKVTGVVLTLAVK